MDKTQWDEFVFSNRGGYAYYLYDVIALDRWINDKNRSFCIWDDDNKEIVLIAQLHLEKHTKNGETYYRLHSRWGFVIKDNLTKRENQKVCDEYKKHINEYYEQYDIRDFDSCTPPLTEENWPGRECINPLMKLGFAPGVRYTWIVNLNKSEEELLAHCEQTTRQAIRKYSSSGRYQIIEAKGTREEFEIYQRLHEETYTRTGGKDIIIYKEYNENIILNLVPKGRSRVFFLKDTEENAIVADVAILIYKNTAYYWWGASVNNKEIGINKYLLWKSMITVSNDYFVNPKMESIMEPDSFYFETGGAYPYLNSGKSKGLNDFKKCFGCQLHSIFTGNYCQPLIL